MPEPNVIHSTFVIERLLPAAPERVFAALSLPAQKRQWYAESRTHDVVEFSMDFRPGGVDISRFRLNAETPFPGSILINRTTYQDIVPDRRIVLAYTMAFGDKTFSASLATFELLPEGPGTHLFFTEQSAFFEGADGPAMRQDGWTKLIHSLAGYLRPR